MNKVHLPNVSLRDVSIPDLPSVPDMGGLASSLSDFAESAADAISSAAGHVPGLHDYRRSDRRRNVLLTIGAIAAVLAVVALIRRRSSDDEVSTAEGNRAQGNQAQGNR
ncbi:MAG: hypothetical protein ABIP17_08980 [Ilumatobacteraceae bacterium]